MNASAAIDERSLFIISLPRSMSSFTHRVARRALDLSTPVWTTDGEVLNNDRYVMYGGPSHDCGRKFTQPRTEPEVALRLDAFLDQVIRPRGFAYKDVVQPFVLSRWLTARDHGLAVLRIRRNLADVAFSMLEKRWLYPARVHEETKTDPEAALLRGLLDAEAALDSVPATEVDYDDLIRDESALLDALQSVAPGRGMTSLTYIDNDFCRVREIRLRNRETERYRLLSARLEEIRKPAPTTFIAHSRSRV